jgi:hypothetical protein
MGYAEKAKAMYGDKCEWFGCGWDQGTCDVHHMNYGNHQDMENHLRAYFIMNDMKSFDLMQVVATSMGCGLFNFKTRQLPKDDRTQNTVVLCPNHHRFVHTIDLKMNIVSYIPKRKK